MICATAYQVTRAIVPWAALKLGKKLSGVDQCKFPTRDAIPQSMGLVSGSMFLVSLLMIPFALPTLPPTLPSRLDEKYQILMLSICFAMLLGFADDVMDLRWSHKLFLGLVYALPLVTSYSGPTAIVLPRHLYFMTQWWPVSLFAEGEGLLELGQLYLLYVIALTIFCTNSINIYAGINGIEVGQSVVIACAIAFLDILEIRGEDHHASPHFVNHLFSLTVMLPFIATSSALLSFNWYPARVFVGDIFPYYAGMTFAATAILGHYSRSLLLLMIPQLLNFLYSLPQLLGVIPCPRHRLPQLNRVTGKLEPSRVASDKDAPANLTLLCLCLQLLGPLHEKTLVVILLIFQVATFLFVLLVFY
jgi:UDP-N-acetylglucosamine--dolichyl-phosphate N-acetylglucosaminephosphotransferase